MAKDEDSVGSDKAELKVLLRIAANKPVHMAFALDGGGKAIVKMDKLKQPKALEKQLKEGDKASKQHRFGTVSVDPDDPKMAVFTVNKAVAGIARKLSVALKGTGFSKVRIMLEDGSTAEEAAGDDEDDAADGQGGSQGDGTSPDDGQSDGGGQSQDASQTANQGPSLPAGDAPGQGGGGLGGLAGGMLGGIGAAVGQAEGVAGGIASMFGSQDMSQYLAQGGSQELTPDQVGDAAPDQSADQSADADSQDAGPRGADGSGTRPYTDPDADTPAAAAEPDAGALTQQLTGLVRQMLGVIAKDPSQKSALAELATDAQVSLKKGNLDQAAAGIDILRQAIQMGASGGNTQGAGGTGPAPAAAPDPVAAYGSGFDAGNGQDSSAAANGADPSSNQPPDPAMTQKLQKSHAAWDATRGRIEGELKKLTKAILDAADGEDMGDNLENEFAAVVEPVLRNLDATLSDTLKQAAGASSAAERAKLLQNARMTVGRYKKFVQGNAIIGELDQNPFMPMTIGKLLRSTLTVLEKTMA